LPMTSANRKIRSHAALRWAGFFGVVDTYSRLLSVFFGEATLGPSTSFPSGAAVCGLAAPPGRVLQALGIFFAPGTEDVVYAGPCRSPCKVLPGGRIPMGPNIRGWSPAALPHLDRALHARDAGVKLWRVVGANDQTIAIPRKGLGGESIAGPSLTEGATPAAGNLLGAPRGKKSPGPERYCSPRKRPAAIGHPRPGPN